jgi:hypothetical protein
VKLEVAKDEAITHGSEGRKISVTTNLQVMPSYLISTAVGSKQAASSSKCVANTNRRKRRQMLL